MLGLCVFLPPKAKLITKLHFRRLLIAPSAPTLGNQDVGSVLSMLGTGCNFLHMLNPHPAVSNPVHILQTISVPVSPSSSTARCSSLTLHKLRCPFTGSNQGHPTGHEGLLRVKIEFRSRADTCICPCEVKEHPAALKNWHHFNCSSEELCSTLC